MFLLLKFVFCGLVRKKKSQEVSRYKKGELACEKAIKFTQSKDQLWA